MRQFSLLDQIEGRLKSHPFPAPQNLGLMARGFEDWAAVIASTEYAHLQAATEQPGILSADTGNCLDRLSDAGLLEPDQSQLLCSAFALYSGVQSLIRLRTEDSFDENDVPAGLQKALSDVGQTTGFEILKRLLQDTEAKVYRCFENLIVQSAACQPSAEGIQKQL
ncbi:MAG TPA: hypothetical protein EYQ81_00865 [Sneathiellales bacterium]|nr:hypothetical protein [Sneathiellales bacterium]